MKVPTGFTPISLNDYVELHLRANPGTDRAELIAQLKYAIEAYRKDDRCQCGAPIWVIGLAQAGLSCFGAEVEVWIRLTSEPERTSLHYRYRLESERPSWQRLIA